MDFETERLVMREFAADDWRATHDCERDPEVARDQTSTRSCKKGEWADSLVYVFQTSRFDKSLLDREWNAPGARDAAPVLR
jgi:hypothetical protein